MHIRIGSDRIVLVFPTLGFVVKIPIIRIIEALYRFFEEILKKNWRGLRKRFRHPMRMPWSIPGMLFRGLSANWKEFTFYIKTQNPILQPTSFSFFGLFNIEKYGEPCREENNPCDQLIKITGRRGVEMDMHHLANPKNFCIINGKLRFLDYGSKETQAFILKYGDKIYKEFKLE